MTTVRRVRRVVRRVDTWTVFKVSALLYLVLGVAIVLGLVMAWSVIDRSGIPQRITDFLIDITLLDEGSAPFGESDRFLRVAVFGTLVWSVLATGLTTLGAVMYNLVADIVGGVEVVVLEEVLPPPPATPVVTPPLRPPAMSNVDLPTEETPVSSGG
jgi:hypothetical protein